MEATMEMSALYIKDELMNAFTSLAKVRKEFGNLMRNMTEQQKLTYQPLPTSTRIDDLEERVSHLEQQLKDVDERLYQMEDKLIK